MTGVGQLVCPHCGCRCRSIEDVWGHCCAAMPEISDSAVERARNAWNVAAQGESGNASDWMRAALEAAWPNR